MPAAPTTRTRTAPLLVALAAALAVAGAPALAVGGTSSAGVLDPGLAGASQAVQRVVVSGATGVAGAVDAVRRAVEAVGGDVGRTLPIVDGVSATVPTDRLAELAGRPGVRAVTADRTGTFAAASFDKAVSASPYVHSIGAPALWGGSRGEGVGVAVIDTGITPVGDLAGRVVSGPDLSGENDPQRDSYGHGTVMAGALAGSGAASGSEPRTGVAPGAHVVSVKVAGANGATDVSTVLAAMHWVAAFRADYDIEVLSLSWGVPSTQDPRVDPLDHAVERLWQLGITVVVAVGNSGPGASTVTKPGDDPMVITVGAYDDRGDASRHNDRLPDWTSRGPTAQGAAKPDLVAPGRTLVTARAPGSTVETQNPSALVGTDYIVGSGSSQATAATAGAVALLKARHPSWTPDQVKHALLTSAAPVSGAAVTGQGRGRLDVVAADRVDVASAPVQSATSTGLGSLEASRGLAPRLTVPCGAAEVRVTLSGERTAWCSEWNGNAWTGNAWTGNAWTGNAWTGNAWTGNAWTGNAWTGTAWTGNAWTGNAWTGNAWTGNAWTGNAWTGNAWTGNAWTGNAWTGNAWTGNAWTGNAWTGAGYGEAEGGESLLTAFWGTKVKHGKKVAGEQNDEPTRARHKDDKAQDR